MTAVQYAYSVIVTLLGCVDVLLPFVCKTQKQGLLRMPAKGAEDVHKPRLQQKHLQGGQQVFFVSIRFVFSRKEGDKSGYYKKISQKLHLSACINL